jgi:hypothetical protein
MENCVTCATPLVEGAKFCVECGTTVAQSGVVLEKFQARDFLAKLIELRVANEIVKPKTYGVPSLEALLSNGDYGQAYTDFDTFFDERPPLLITVVFCEPDTLAQVYRDFTSACGQNLLGTIELDECVIFVSADYAREESDPNGVERIADAVGGTPTVLIGSKLVPPVKNFMYKCSEDIVDVFVGAGLVTTVALTPAKYDLADQVESSVFKFCPFPSDEDKVMIVCVYLDVPAKGMFSYDESLNQAKLSDENWVIEFSSNSLTPSEFKQSVKRFADEVGGQLSL